MIGVIPRADQVEVVEEFFELFKTPWEPYRPGQAYDVIIATADEIPQVRTRLLLVYGPTTKGIDAQVGIAARRRQQGGLLSDQDWLLPIYGQMLTFEESNGAIPFARSNGEIAALGTGSHDAPVIRFGYDLFDEVKFLLSSGQPVEQAHVPTLDIHVGMLRKWILDAGIPFIEIPPVPAQHSFVVCLTHDIDFVGIRNHRLDHSMWGFVYRATAGALGKLVRGRLSWRRLLRSWLAAASLPLVYAGWAKDFWEPFDWYLEVEEGLPATYFLIPFKRRAGEKVPGPHASRRATAYDIKDLPHETTMLLKKGCELGVHGLDAWHSADKGRSELNTISSVTGESNIGIRMHWLLCDANTPSVLEQAGYAYDSTFGYNETVGYRAGTGQVFRPLSAKTLLEIPIHIQDGALFYRQRLDLTEAQARERCQSLIDNASKLGGVLTILWHDRSHGPERLWGDFYVRLVQTLKSLDSWFGTAAQVVAWFRKRREVRFERMEGLEGTRTRLCYEGGEIQPPLTIRLYRPSRRVKGREPVCEATTKFVDIPWNGTSADDLDFQMASALSATLPGIALYSLS